MTIPVLIEPATGADRDLLAAQGTTDVGRVIQSRSTSSANRASFSPAPANKAPAHGDIDEHRLPRWLAVRSGDGGGGDSKAVRMAAAGGTGAGRRRAPKRGPLIKNLMSGTVGKHRADRDAAVAHGPMAAAPGSANGSGSLASRLDDSQS